MAESTKSSIKDEIVTVIILIPLILVFIPGMEQIVKNGFDRLNELPEWYTYLVFLTISAALGIKGVDKFRKKVMDVVALTEHLLKNIRQQKKITRQCWRMVR